MPEQPTTQCLNCASTLTPRQIGRKGKYCSRACHTVAQNTIEERPCLNCGTPFRPRSHGTPGKYCSYRCRNQHRTGPLAPNWRGGEIDGATGYARTYIPGVGMVYNHRIVMALHLGRLLGRDEIVHHRNGDRLDNRIENLELLTRADHTILHGANGSLKKH